MPIEFIGFLAHQETSESIGSHGPLINPEFLAAAARTQEYGGFDKALIAYHSAAPDALQVAAYAARDTTRLGLLVAHRPGVTAPTVAARQFATLDHFSQGRASVNIITGGNDTEQQRDGDFLGHDERYERSDEYLSLMKQAWQSAQPFDFDGRHYRVRGHFTQVRPLQQGPQGPQIPIYFSGSSAAAVSVAGKHADVFMMWGEPLAGIREQIAAVRAAAARHGRSDTPRFSLSIRPILGATEDEAWARAERILAATRSKLEKVAGNSNLRQWAAGQPQNVGSQRLAAFAAQGTVLDKRLWTGIAALTGAVAGTAAATGIGGNSTALVGTPAQVAEALLDYHDLGVSTFLIRGFEPLLDAVLYGRELIPEVTRQRGLRSNPVSSVAPVPHLG
jgi:alkanesulfonate monooxygenase